MQNDNKREEKVMVDNMTMQGGDDGESDDNNERKMDEI